MTDALSNPIIGVSYVETIPDELIAPFLAEVHDERIQLIRDPRPDAQMFANAEWFIPTAIFVFLSKAYFDGFLQAAGADHYQKLRSALSKLMKRMSLIRVTYLGSGRKVKKDNPYSGAISLLGEGGGGVAFKLLFRTDADEQEIALSITCFLEFLRAYHEDSSATNMIEDFGKFRPVGGLHLVFYDRAQRKLRLQNPRG